MGMFGGAGAGGWSTGIGGQAMGPQRAGRNADGWDDEYLGKVYDAKVVQRILPYLKPYKKQAVLAFICMVVSAITSFLQPLLIGMTVKAGVNGDTNRVWWLLGIMVGSAAITWLSAYLQLLTTAW